MSVCPQVSVLFVTPALFKVLSDFQCAEASPSTPALEALCVQMWEAVLNVLGKCEGKYWMQSNRHIEVVIRAQQSRKDTMECAGRALQHLLTQQDTITKFRSAGRVRFTRVWCAFAR